MKAVSVTVLFSMCLIHQTFYVAVVPLPAEVGNRWGHLLGSQKKAPPGRVDNLMIKNASIDAISSLSLDQLHRLATLA